MTNAIDPGHYKGFSNGAQVIDISENLTSNAGQAVQYIARSCRLDGANKGDQIEDLKKAQWFLAREIERLRATPKQGDDPMVKVFDKFVTASQLAHAATSGLFNELDKALWDSWHDVPEGVWYRQLEDTKWRWVNRNGRRFTNNCGGVAEYSSALDDEDMLKLAPFVRADA